MKKLLLLCIIFFGLTSCQKDDPTITSISLDKTALSIVIGNTYQFTVSYQPNDLQAPSCKWVSSNTDVATVDNAGKIIAKNVGTTIIKATTANNLDASCTVTVTPIEATSIALNKERLDLLMEQEEILTFEIAPENTTNKKVLWLSDNDNIATVDKSGKIRAVGVGQTKIHVKLPNNIADVCDVTVNPINLTEISFNEKSKTMEELDRTSLNVVFTPTNATNKEIKWESSDSNIAIVSEDGVVTGKKIGTATITATSEDGGFKAKCDITVNLKGLVLVVLDGKEIMTNERRAVWVKSEATNEAYLGAIWSSSNPNVATVQSDGNETNSAVIIPKQVGTATITAYNTDHTKSAEYTVNIKDITEFIKVKGDYSIKSFSNGYLTGTCTSNITNNSKQSIKLKSLKVVSPTSGNVYYINAMDKELNSLRSAQIADIQISNWYKPIFRWTIEWNNQEYVFDEQTFK